MLAVTHSLWGWCQPHSATGMTWCSPLLWRYSSSASIASGDIIPMLLTATSGPSNRYLSHQHHYISGWEQPREWPLNVKSTPELPTSSSSSQTPTPPPLLHEHHIRLFFWSGPPLSASPPISSEAPVFFLHRGAELECRAPPLWQCSWLIPEQSDSWETLNELATLKTPAYQHQETRIWAARLQVWHITEYILKI